jgi:hypothetical protein
MWGRAMALPYYYDRMPPLLGFVLIQIHRSGSGDLNVSGASSLLNLSRDQNSTSQMVPRGIPRQLSP